MGKSAGVVGYAVAALLWLYKVESKVDKPGPLNIPLYQYKVWSSWDSISHSWDGTTLSKYLDTKDLCRHKAYISIKRNAVDFKKPNIP